MKRAARNQPSKRHRHPEQRPDGPQWRVVMHDVIFESDTFWGKAFDVMLLVVILISIGALALETVPRIGQNTSLLSALMRIEQVCTIFFGTEYLLRIVSSRQPLRYAFSFWGIIDLLSFLPSILAGFGNSGERSFIILRSIRLLRVFRVLKLVRMVSEAEELSRAVWNARDKIIVFLCVILIAVTISGTLMYHVENLPGSPQSQFDSIPQSMYWAVVTMTTVGYGDIVPKTTIGKCISAALILLGYSLIIVPSGFVSAEFTTGKMRPRPNNDRTCPKCFKVGHPDDANYCNQCGTLIRAETNKVACP